MNCPHCGTAINIGRLIQSQRKTLGGGAPRSRKKRCACGEMTAKRAEARGHKCGYGEKRG